MAKRVDLIEDILTNRQLKTLTRSYQEQAIGQINFARYSVLSSRQFAQELDEIFYNVKTSYKNALLEKAKKQNKTQISLPTLKKNGKEALVLLSANNKLYGDIILKICQLFVERAKKSDADLFVIGSRGKDYVDQLGLNKPYSYFDVPDTNVTIDLLKKTTTGLLGYEKVLVFYGKFENIVTQLPSEEYISGALPQNTTQKDGQDHFLFEPSIEEILVFFENQIFSILLNQIIQESQLARFASRIKAMEQAQDNIQNHLDKLIRVQKRIKNMEDNKKQLEILAGRSLWGKT